jgi:hypothetical protein
LTKPEVQLKVDELATAVGIARSSGEPGCWFNGVVRAVERLRRGCGVGGEG